MKKIPWQTFLNKDPIETFIFIDFETTGLFCENSADPQSKRWIAGDHTRKPEELLYNFHNLSKLKKIFILLKSIN